MPIFLLAKKIQGIFNFSFCTHPQTAHICLNEVQTKQLTFARAARTLPCYGRSSSETANLSLRRCLSEQLQNRLGCLGG